MTYSQYSLQSAPTIAMQSNIAGKGSYVAFISGFAAEILVLVSAVDVDIRLPDRT